MRVVGRLSYASTLEARQHSLLPAWQWPTWLMLLTWLVVHIYSFIRYNHYGGSAWHTVILWVSPGDWPWQGTWLSALTQTTLAG